MEDKEITSPEADDFWVDVGDAEPEEAKWLIEGLLPVGLSFIGGPAKTMKTTAAVGMANLISGHECGLFPPFMSKVHRSGRVMMLEAEATPGELRYMIEKDMGVKLEADGTILTAKDCAEFRLDDPGALKRLLYWLDKFKPRLFIVDPMREFHDKEEKDSGEMQRLLRPLRRWAIDTESGFLVVHHTTKPGEQHSGVYNPLDLRGSGGLFGAANGVIMVSPTKVDGQLIFASKFKRGASTQHTVRLGIFGAKAAEVLEKSELAVLKLLRTVNPNSSGLRVANEGWIAASTQAPDRWVHDTMLKLERNNMASHLVGFPKSWIANGPGVENA